MLYVVPYYPKIHSANELPRAYLVKALVDHQTLSIDDSIARWGTTVDVSPWQGRSYSNKAPGTSLLTAPVYAAARLAGEPSLALTIWMGRLVTGVLPTLLLLALLPGFLARYGVGAAASRLVAVTYALGSMAMPFSMLFIAHQPSAVALALAWILAQRVADAAAPPPMRSGGAGQGGRSLRRRLAGWLGSPVGRMALAGTAAGWAPLLDYQAAFALPPLALFLGWQLWRRPDRWALLAAAALGAAPPIALLLGYHALAFGSPWRTGYDASVTFAVYHQQGFLGITALRWRAFANSMVGPDNGLLTFAPWLLLALPGLVLLARRGRRAEAAAIAAIAALYILFLSSITFWRGGWQMGPRYIIAMLPFLLPPVAVAVQACADLGQGNSRGRRLALVLTLAACFIGVLVYAGSCAQFPHFPERFHNPLFEVTLRLWTDGMAAPNPLLALGVPGPWSLLPYIAAVVAAVSLAVRGLASTRLALVALALAVALFAALSLAPRTGAGGESAYQWVRSTMAR